MSEVISNSSPTPASSILLKCCRAAEAVLAEYYDGTHPLRQTLKDAAEPRTIVTEADLDAERAIVSILSRELDCDFLSEEGCDEPAVRRHRLRAIIDPLDGSKNFIHRTLGLFGVSIALEDAGDVFAGAICLPQLRQTIYGERGSGVRVYSAQLQRDVELSRAAGSHDLSRARINIARGSLRSEVLISPPLSTIVKTCNECLNLASCTVALAAVLVGGLDGAILCGQRLWDFAAGLFLFRESGAHFGVWSEDWAASVDRLTLANATARSKFNIVAAEDSDMFNEISQLLTSR